MQRRVHTPVSCIVPYAVAMAVLVVNSCSTNTDSYRSEHAGSVEKKVDMIVTLGADGSTGAFHFDGQDVDKVTQSAQNAASIASELESSGYELRAVYLVQTRSSLPDISNTLTRLAAQSFQGQPVGIHAGTQSAALVGRRPSDPSLGTRSILDLTTAPPHTEVHPTWQETRVPGEVPIYVASTPDAGLRHRQLMGHPITDAVLIGMVVGVGFQIVDLLRAVTDTLIEASLHLESSEAGPTFPARRPRSYYQCTPDVWCEALNPAKPYSCWCPATGAEDGTCYNEDERKIRENQQC